MEATKKKFGQKFTKSDARAFLRKYGLALLFTAPFLVCFALFFVYPFFKGIVMSFFRWNIADSGDIVWRGFENYKKILFDSSSLYFKEFWTSLGRTMLAVLVLVPLCIVLPFILAVLIEKRPYCKKLFQAIIYLPGIFPLSATGVIFLNLFNYEYGFINSLFNIDVNWLQNPSTVWVLIVLFCVWGGLGSNFIIFSAAIKDVDKSLYEAASIDGCSKFKQAFYITLPSIKRQITLCLFTTMCGYMGLYGQNYILGAYAMPHESIETVIFKIQNFLQGTQFEAYGMISAMAICLGIFTALVSGLQMLITREKK